ncbi:MAG: CsbD family protein [Ilumatobacter sp.]|uniref:CsbD family protein n=1 Tax=Ilumatobacter sp. TaxID=1967498 RepID=UPI00391B5B87
MSQHDNTSTDSTTDEIKGRAKEATGAVTDDDDLKEAGRDDQRAAAAKDKVDQASDAVKQGIDKIKNRLSN